MFSVCVCVYVFLCLCTGRGLVTSWSPVQGVLPTVPDQETTETQPYAPKSGSKLPSLGATRKKKMLPPFFHMHLLHHKLSNYGSSSVSTNWFLNYFTNRQSRVCYSGILFSPLVVQSGVPQGLVLGPLLINIFVNGLCDVIDYYNCLLFADDLTIYQAISSLNDVYFYRCCVHKWCSANSMKLNFRKIRVTSFTKKTNVLNYRNTLGIVYLRAAYIKDLGVHIDCKYFHCQKLLGHILAMIFFFSHLRQSTDAVLCFGQISTWICFCCLKLCYDYWFP
jgi:hypothetical protein